MCIVFLLKEKEFLVVNTLRYAFLIERNTVSNPWDGADVLSPIQLVLCNA